MRSDKLKTISIICFNLISFSLFSQSSDSVSVQKPLAILHTYPEIKGYIGILHPLYTLSKEGNTVNFKDYYLVGNPWGINIWKSKRYGFSFELTPFIRADNKGSKLSNFLFHPGVLYRIKHDFTLVGRVAYETSGRYGLTPGINKVLIRTPYNTFFVALMMPVRFGNNHAPSYTASFQFGIGF
jgi:hypothetical protein